MFHFLHSTGRETDIEKRIFNYRLSRARRISENAFGILSARWRIFRRPIEAQPVVVDSIIKSTVVLHNYLKKTDYVTEPTRRYVSPSLVDSEANDGCVVSGEWRNITQNDANLRRVGRTSTNTSSQYAQNVREKINFIS